MILIFTALAAEQNALGGVSIGARFVASEWMQQSEGYYVRTARVAGVYGELVPHVCSGVVDGLTFNVWYSSVPSSDGGIVLSDSPRTDANAAKTRLEAALSVAGYRSLMADGVWTKEIDGATLYRATSVDCRRRNGGTVELCSASIVATDPTKPRCTEGL